MEIALESEMATYSGGLGGLAGDTVRSAADLEVPMAVISLLHRKGYFFQKLDAAGHQSEAPVDWPIDDYLEEMPARTTVSIEGRTVHLRAWRYDVEGVSGATVPVFFLDADLPENDEADRHLTDRLYGGDERYRFCQEVILGIGGVRMLHALGYEDITRYHMNEGHASLLTLELLHQSSRAHGRDAITRADIEAVRDQCIFTTHTPVPAGHDTFPMGLVDSVLPRSVHDFVDASDAEGIDTLRRIFQLDEAHRDVQAVLQKADTLNMTYLALNLSRYVNAVAKKHGEVSRAMFPGYAVDSITNGVHVDTWVVDSFRSLFDEYLPGWQADNYLLRNALAIPSDKVWDAHQDAKRELLKTVQQRTNVAMDLDVFTIGFARRMAMYKRADLLFTDLNRLRKIAETVGPFQIIYAGKAHPKDEGGKQIIQRIFEAREALGEAVKITYLPNYDKATTKLMAAGVDVWLNTPRPPNEASGTSGMKAALNGVPQFSTLDGWWLEGWIEDVTGWAIGTPVEEGPATWDEDARALYAKLEHVILPQYYRDKADYQEVMRHAIAVNGSFFNTQRMVEQYVMRAYC